MDFLRNTQNLKNLPDGFDKSADLLSKGQNHQEDFFKFCVLLKKSKLYLKKTNGQAFRSEEVQKSTLDFNEKD